MSELIANKMNIISLKRPLFQYSGRTYYFDSIHGADENDGLSKEAAKKSLEAMNELVPFCCPGDRILVACGSVYHGKLLLDGFHADQERPIYFGVYGDGAKPIIDGNGENCAVEIKDGYLVFDGLEIINKKGVMGIFVHLTEPKTLAFLTIENCYIHDVNWNWTEKLSPEKCDFVALDVENVCPNECYDHEMGGIVFIADSPLEKGACNFEDVWILNNRIEYVSRSGIFLTGMWFLRPGTSWGINPYYSDTNGWYPSKRIEIAGNEVIYSGGDGIVLIGALDSYIEGNISYHSNYLGRKGTANAGIWPMGCKRVVVQYNEAAYSHLEHGGADGEGFDIDTACEDIIFRCNYAHDNDGGAILLCNAKTAQPLFDENGNAVLDENGKQKVYEEQGLWRNVTIRDCIFINNGKTPENPNFIHLSSTCQHLNVFNNTVIMRTDVDKQLIVRTADYANCGRQKYLYFGDNLFCAKTPLDCGFWLDYADGCIFEDNLYYNVGADCAEKSQDLAPQTTEEEPIDFPDGNLDGFDKAIEIVKKTRESVKRKYGAKLEF